MLKATLAEVTGLLISLATASGVGAHEVGCGFKSMIASCSSRCPCPCPCPCFAERVKCVCGCVQLGAVLLNSHTIDSADAKKKSPHDSRDYHLSQPHLSQPHLTQLFQHHGTEDVRARRGKHPRHGAGTGQTTPVRGQTMGCSVQRAHCRCGGGIGARRSSNPATILHLGPRRLGFAACAAFCADATAPTLAPRFQSKCFFFTTDTSPQSQSQSQPPQPKHPEPQQSKSKSKSKPSSPSSCAASSSHSPSSSHNHRMSHHHQPSS